MLTLSASGWTYDYLFVLWDYETGSVWYQLPGETQLTAIGGPLAGRSLPTVPSSTMLWAEWIAEHPDTGFMR